MKWSSLQEDIFEAGRDLSDSLVVVARAGSGKTTTLIELAKRLPVPSREAGIIAFANRSKDRIGSAEPPKHYAVKTAHSLGLGILKKHNPFLLVDNKGEKMLRLVSDELPNDRNLHEPVSVLVKRAKTRLIEDARELRALAALGSDMSAVGLDGDKIVEAASRVLFMARERDDWVDFDDMIWLPIMLGLHGGTFELLFVDELQDLTRAQVRLVAMLTEGGRVVGFGDPAQAIYQFAGADTDAVEALSDMMKAVKLPLSISYRCAKNIVKEAQQLVPDIEAHPDNPDGCIFHGEGQPYLNRHMRVNDLVLSRTNAPLLGIALECARQNLPAQIVGRALDKEMMATLERSGTSTVGQFLRWIGDWGTREMNALKHEGLDYDHILDKVASFEVLCRGAKGMSEVRQRIARVFVERRGAAVQLSTVHQMKGEEADRVFVLQDTFRVKKLFAAIAAGEKPKSSEEANLFYVAITRARRDLHYVQGIR
jgi:DNA helicase-2/ATP-dependent DNA helicase PcrA